MTKFTKHMQCKAEAIADFMERETKKPNSYPKWEAHPLGRGPDKPSNIKPWYNPPDSFRSGVKRVLIGINPGGNPINPDGPCHECRNPKWHGETFNEWVCAEWRKNGRVVTTHQQPMLDVFKALYGNDKGKRKLVNTPSSNVCPLRTEDPKHIPGAVWDESENWCLTLLEHLRPGTIICNGNSTSGERPHRSPWSMVLAKQSDGNYDLEKSERVSVGHRKYLKHGIVRGGKLDGAHVIGMPQGIRGSRRKLHLELGKLIKLHKFP